MPSTEAPKWLREAFRDGVDDAVAHELAQAPWDEGQGVCWLRPFDTRRQPCSGKLERFHFIGRQRVRNLLWDALLYAVYAETQEIFETRETIMLAEWDARNGGIGCEGHHRRFDGHACSARAPKIVIAGGDVPGHVREFACCYGLEMAFAERFAGTEVIGPITAPILVT